MWWFPSSLPAIEDPEWAQPISVSGADDFRFSAWHEAGHAVLNMAVGRPVLRVIVAPAHWAAAGWTWMATVPLVPEAEAITLLGGMAGEMIGGNDAPWHNARSDIRRAYALASGVTGAFLAREAVQECWQVARAFLDRDPVPPLVREIAAHALLRGTLEGDPLCSIIRGFGPLPRIDVPVWNQLSLPLSLPLVLRSS